ncbi:MAG: endonuclease domain-containing protein [Candidatus Magasanikbacteria bacterium]|nr:endonuclease domain-containing protein [Candidatus Magasanikbacteria bacterium]
MVYTNLNQEIKARARALRKNQTKAELILWEKLRAKRLNGLKFLRQHPIIFHENGHTYYFIADFYCNELGLVIELDGNVHDFQKEYDIMRDTVISGMRLKVLRFENVEVYRDINCICQKILDI